MENQDCIVIKQLWKAPVPTNEEVRLLLDLFEDYSLIKTALLLMVDIFPRPREICTMTWNKVFHDPTKQRITKIRHLVYKARGWQRKLGRTQVYKEVEKSIHSDWIAEYLIQFWKLTGGYEGNKLFSWTTPDSFGKEFSKIRKKCMNGDLSKEYDFLLDKCDETLQGHDFTQFRVSPYSLRRFSLSFHYWITYSQDVVKLARESGHSNPQTLLKHYIMPYESIGLSKKMIAEKITMDQFLRHKGKKQIDLRGFFSLSDLPSLPENQPLITSY